MLSVVVPVNSAVGSVGRGPITNRTAKKNVVYSFMLADCVSGKLVKV